MNTGHVVRGCVLALCTTAGALAPAAAQYTVTDLGTLGGASSEAAGINATSTMTGDSGTATAGADHAFSESPGSPPKDLGTLGGEYSVGEAIDEAGSIVGYSTLANGHYRAFLRRGGLMTNIGDLGGDYSAAYGINAAGIVVGTSKLPSFKEHAFRFAGGPLQDLGTLGGDTSTAYAINAGGLIVGYSYDIADNFLAFRWQDGQMTSLGTLGGDWSKAFGVNSAGTIVGQAYTAGNLEAHAFSYRGTMTDLGKLSGHYSSAAAINATGTIVGQADVANPTGFLVYHAIVVLPGGRMQDLNTLIPAGSGWTLTNAAAINNDGQIVGYGTIAGAQHAVLLDAHIRLVVSKDTPSGAVHLQWSGALPAFSLERASDTLFTQDVRTLVGHQATTNYEDPVLNDGRSYCYLVD